MTEELHSLGSSKGCPVKCRAGHVLFDGECLICQNAADEQRRHLRFQIRKGQRARGGVSGTRLERIKKLAKAQRPSLK